MRFQKGDRVSHHRNGFIGTVISVKERGVAGSDVTWIEKVEVALDNGVVMFESPDNFRLIEDE